MGFIINKRIRQLLKLCKFFLLKRSFSYCLLRLILTVLLSLFLVTFHNDLANAFHSFPLFSIINLREKGINCFSNISEISNPNDHWLVVPKRRFLIRSAYVVNNGANLSKLTLIGVRFLRYSLPVYCAVIFREKSTKKWTIKFRMGRFLQFTDIAICKTHIFCYANKYEAFGLQCALTGLESHQLKNDQFELLATGVAPEYLLQSNDQEICGIMNENLIPVAQLKPGTNPKYNLSLCVGPLFDWSNILLLNIFMNYYTEQGVEFFTLYKRSWSEDVDNYFEKFYKEKIEIIQWSRLPTFNNDNLNEEKNVHYNGQTIAINDCLYRSKFVSKFVIFIDFDEFIVFRGWKIWDFLRELSQNSDEVSALVLQNRFVSFNLKNLTSPFATVELDNMIYPHTERSKLILRPDRVLKVCIHEICEYEKEYEDMGEKTEILLPYNQGAVFHHKEQKTKEYFSCLDNDCEKIYLHDVIPGLVGM